MSKFIVHRRDSQLNLHAPQQKQRQQSPPQQHLSHQHDAPTTSHHGASGHESEQLHPSRILVSMASMGISAYFLTSGLIQLIFAVLCVLLCGVTFGKDDLHRDITWLAANTWLMGLLRLLLSVCIGRPAYNRNVWSKPSRHAAFTAQIEALAFLPDVRPQSCDMSVLNRTQLAAGIIHPAYYHRTLMVAWQEGMLATLWLILHIQRLLKLHERFSPQKTKSVEERDEFLEHLIAAQGSNFTATPLIEIGYILGKNVTEMVNLMRSPDNLNRLAGHCCEYWVRMTAEIFYQEDMWLLIALGVTLVLLPALARLFKFFYNR